MTTNSDKPRNICLIMIIFCGACWVAVVCSMMGRVMMALLIVINALILVFVVIYLQIGRDDQEG